MEKKVEKEKVNHGKYTVSEYEVEITPEMKEKAWEFSKEIILGDDQYLRNLPPDVDALEEKELADRLRIQRTCAGKLGELAFQELLREKGKKAPDDGMFRIFKGQANVDEYDFLTKNGKKVDIKTGYRENHRRLAVPEKQMENGVKDYYVGVKLNARDTDPEKKLVDLKSVTTARIMGYADGNYLKGKPSSDLGETPAKCVGYEHLMDIDKLLSLFEDE